MMKPTPGLQAAIVLRYLERTGPTTPEALAEAIEAAGALPSPVLPLPVHQAIARLCRAGRAQCVGPRTYAPWRSSMVTR
jgi:hypothetical protein